MMFLRVMWRWIVGFFDESERLDTMCGLIITSFVAWRTVLSWLAFDRDNGWSVLEVVGWSTWLFCVPFFWAVARSEGRAPISWLADRVDGVLNAYRDTADAIRDEDTKREAQAGDLSSVEATHD